MRRCRPLAAAACLTVVLVGAGCTGSDDGPEDAAAPTTDASTTGPPAADSSTAGPSAAAPPPLAGTAEARALARLPEGPATGTALIAYSGVGEVRAPFTGECSQDGDTTRLEGSADTADLRLEVAPGGARLALDDVGLSATSELATGRYDVAGNHLSLAAPLVSGDRSVGRVELEIDCGS